MNDEISLKELLETTFTINENDEMVGTYTLTRINIISNILTNLQQENDNLKNIISSVKEDFLNANNELTNLHQRIEKAIEYINHLSKEPNVFGHYGIHNDCAKWLLKILNGRGEDK